MDDSISRQEAIDLLNEQIKQCNKALSSFDISLKDKQIIEVARATLEEYKEELENLPSAQSEERPKEPCEACKSLENGDTLYSWSDWDGGIGFDYIHNIKYCPVCGREL